MNFESNMTLKVEEANIQDKAKWINGSHLGIIEHQAPASIHCFCFFLFFFF